MSVFRCHSTEVPQTDPEVVLLAKYYDVFEPITELPPVRPVEHSIPLLPNVQPVLKQLYWLTPLELEEVK